MVLMVATIIFAIAIPELMQTYRNYELTDGATRVAGVVKVTRFEAIRRNIAVNAVLQATGGGATIWADSNGDGIEQATESQTLLNGGLNFSSAASVPNTAGLAAAVGIPALTVLSPNDTTTVGFDSRGAVNPAGVYVLYVVLTGVGSAGYRAVILLPSGETQSWSADAAGNWHRFN